MARNYIYVKMTEDYAGHKKDEVLRLRSKIPPHLEAYVDKTTENVYTKYTKEQEAEKRRKAKEAADQEQIQAADPVSDQIATTSDEAVPDPNADIAPGISKRNRKYS